MIGYDELIERLEKVRRHPGYATARCPAHPDHNPSLSVRQMDDGLAVKCFAGCATDDIARAAGIDAKDLYLDEDDEPKILDTYPYHGPDGELLFEVLRMVPKSFRQRRPDGQGGWNWKLGDVQRVPYRLPELREAIDAGRWVFLVEGEKDVHRLEREGLAATTTPGGSGAWRDDYAQWFTGALVAVVPDNDPQGQEYAAKAAEDISRVGKEVRVIALPDLKPKGDVSDWLYSHTKDDLEERVLTAPPYGEDADQADPLPEGVVEELERLRIRDQAKRIFEAEQRPRIDLPEILTLRERLKLPRPPVRWRIEGWQPVDSRAYLAAQFKAGKTTLVGNLQRSLLDGDPWLGVAQVEPVRQAALIDLEMSEHQMDAWLADQGIVNDDRLTVIPLRGKGITFDILNDQVRAEWAERLAGFDYLTLDCLRPVLDALGLSEDKETGLFLTAFDALLSEADIPESAVIQHMGHSGERSRGDSRQRDWPDVEWRLVREDPDDPGSRRYISAYGRDVEQPESLISHDPRTRHLTLSGGSRRQAAARAALDDIIAKLEERDNQPFTGRGAESALAGIHSQKNIRAGLRLGAQEGELQAEPGERNSILYSISASVRQTALPVRQRGSDECVSASIGDALTTQHSDDPARQSELDDAETVVRGAFDVDEPSPEDIAP